MPAKWFIVKLGSQEHLERLFYAIQETGREVEIIPLKQVAEMEEIDQTKECIITAGSIWSNSYLKQVRPNWVGNWHSRDTFLCSRYYSYWGKYLTQQKYCFMPFAEVLRQKDWLYATYGNEKGVFVRPDSGEKDFTGEVVSTDMFPAWSDRVLNVLNIPADTLCVVSSPVDITKELRLIISNGKVVTGSSYKIVGHIIKEPLEGQDDEAEIIDYAQSVLADNPPPLPPIHCLDIAVHESGPVSGYSIMEVGCFCCAGLYDCDRRKLALAISLTAEAEFAKEFV